jgi:hypothetical protein
MFATKLPAFLLGLVALPSIAFAGPAKRIDDASRQSDRAGIRDEAGNDRAELAKTKRLNGLCARLDCSADQLAAIQSITKETRRRLAAERSDDHQLFERAKALHAGGLDRDEIAMLRAAIASERSQYQRLLEGGINGIANVLDERQRDTFMSWVDELGPKVVFGFAGHAGGKAKAKAKANRERRERNDEDGGLTSADNARERAAKVKAKRERAHEARKLGLEKRERRDALEKRHREHELAKRERHSAKA